MSTKFESDNPTADDVHDALTDVYKAAAGLVDALNKFENDEAASVAPVLDAIECWDQAKLAGKRQIKRAAFLFDDLDMPVDRRPSALLSGELHELGHWCDVLIWPDPPGPRLMRQLVMRYGHDYFQRLLDQVIALRGHCDKLSGFLDRPRPPAATTSQADDGPAAVDDEARLSPAELAERFDVPQDALRQRLDEWRKTNDQGWHEITDRKPRESKYMYRLESVRHIIKQMKATSQLSSE
ncbi:MAG: hypothetical protein IH988_04190 [Planctomycetes bacterium]|nr:hypothetical protein [Planctomycetota bacterium]